MWQTIDSAPRDGTRVLLFCPSFDLHVAFGHYVNDETLSYGVSVFTLQGWSINYQIVDPTVPTHWMPIPADPEITP